MPELRREFLCARLFLTPRSAALDVAAAGGGGRLDRSPRTACHRVVSGAGDRGPRRRGRIAPCSRARQARAEAGRCGRHCRYVVGLGSLLWDRRAGARPFCESSYPRPVRVFSIGNMYPPHHFGGYELMWRSNVVHLRARNHAVRVLTTDYCATTPDGDLPEHVDVHRELRWYWRDHAAGRGSRCGNGGLERHNLSTLERHLDEFKPDLVSWWAMGGMSMSLIEAVRRRSIPAIGLYTTTGSFTRPRRTSGIERCGASARSHGARRR